MTDFLMKFRIDDDLKTHLQIIARSEYSKIFYLDLYNRFREFWGDSDTMVIDALCAEENLVRNHMLTMDIKFMGLRK